MIHHKKDDNTKNNKVKSHIQELGHKLERNVTSLKLQLIYAHVKRSSY
jgi:hypothetical protein